MTKWRVLKVLVIGVSLYFTYTLTKSLLELYQARDRVTTQQKMLEEVKTENANLRLRLEEVRSLDFLEKEARENLNMQLPGETVVVLDNTKVEKRKTEPKKEKKLNNWRKWFDLIF